MARQEKGTRIRGLPARVQKSQIDAASGTYPTKFRLSADNVRLGRERIFFDDTKTIVFAEANSHYYPGIGLNSGSKYLQGQLASDLPLATTITATGHPIQSVIDESYIITNNLLPTSLNPFIEDNLFEVEGKSSSSTFFKTGSAVEEVGEGFDTPVWSKHRIEIDISVVASSTLKLVRASAYNNNVSGTSYPMAYYNFSTKRWDPIGLGYAINSTDDVTLAIERMMIGFGSALLPSGETKAHVQQVGSCISDFGFPSHPKFHATSSQTLKMSKYIDRPFLLEKAVITLSGSWSIGNSINVNATVYDSLALNDPSRQTITASINTCFLLNQRRNQNIKFGKPLSVITTQQPYVNSLNITIPTSSVLSVGGPSIYVDTVRDIIGFSQIYSFAKDAYDKVLTWPSASSSALVKDIINITENDLVLNNSNDSSITGSNWSEFIKLSMKMCTPVGEVQSYVLDSGMFLVVTGALMTKVIAASSSYNVYEVTLGYDGYRTGLGLIYPSSRGLLNDFYRNPSVEFYNVEKELNVFLKVVKGKWRYNPYILLPSDELILGWQIPISYQPAMFPEPGTAESTFTFLPGNFKMVLYGSFIKEGREFYDTINQLLTSNAVHEIIE